VLGQIGGLHDNAGSMKEGAHLICIAPEKIEFLNELSPQLLEDKVGNYQLMM
jgi:hypothetical protein